MDSPALHMGAIHCAHMQGNAQIKKRVPIKGIRTAGNQNVVYGIKMQGVGLVPTLYGLTH